MAKQVNNKKAETTKKKGRARKSISKIKGGKLYVKVYRGQGR
jgi:hypothetical protein